MKWGGDERKRPSAGAAGWRAGGAPGLRPDELEYYRFDEDRRSARWFSGSLRRVAVFGPYRSASDGRGLPAKAPGTTEYPPQPLPSSHTRRRRSRVLRSLDLIPLHRSRRSQGRRPYEPSVRRDGGRLAQDPGEAGRMVRETMEALKGRGILGAVIATAVSSLTKLGRWRGGEADVTEGVLRVGVR